jgi:hypothetical protein
VLVEKILRVQPDVKKLFLLIRAADVESAKQRVETEVKTKYFSLFTYKDSGIIYFKRSARALPKYISRRKKSYIGKLHTGSKKKKRQPTTNHCCHGKKTCSDNRGKSCMNLLSMQI